MPPNDAMSDGTARIREGSQPPAQAIEVPIGRAAGPERLPDRDGVVEPAHGAQGSRDPASAGPAVGCGRTRREEGVQLREAMPDDRGAGARAEASAREGPLEIVEPAPKPARGDLLKGDVAAVGRDARIVRAGIAIVAPVA